MRKRPPDIETLVTRAIIFIDWEWKKAKGDIYRKIEILKITNKIRNSIIQSIKKLKKRKVV